jgi:hypothetical protein
MIPDVIGTLTPSQSPTSQKDLHTIAFARLKSPPPIESMQFYDGFFPALTARTYTIDVHHTVQAPSGTSPEYSWSQSFIVQAPEFTIDPSIVASTYPANGSSAILDQQLPNIALKDPALPWERSLVPPSGQTQAGATNPVSWMALVLFAEGEIHLLPDSSSPLTTCTVTELLTPVTGVLKPQIPQSDISTEMLASQCQTILIPGTSFAVIPNEANLAYLAHCRAVNSPDEDPSLMSVLLANRLPLANTTTTPATPLRYYAHLVSLEGFADYIGPNPKPIPSKTGGGLVDVELVSLFSWTFTSMPEVGASFEELIQGLIDSETVTPTLRLPPPPPNPASPVPARLSDGYAPLTFVSGSGEESFAWYRGPLSAVVAQPLPKPDPVPTSPLQRSSADALMIYLAQQGLFDLSYAAAWNMGRGLALADSAFSVAVRNYGRNAATALNRMASNATGGADEDYARLLLPQAAKLAFSGRIAGGLGATWSSALAAAHRYGVAEPQLRRRRPPRRSRVRPLHLLAEPGVTLALEEHLSEATDPVASWLADLANLIPIPFSSLVPVAGMLPVESIRFFYIDPGWMQALRSGALSLAIQTEQDLELLINLLPGIVRKSERMRGERMRRRRTASVLDAGDPVATSGLLIRSELIANWPGLVISASAKGAPINILRDATLSPNVRLLLFEGIPDTVTLAEPYQGLQFGVQDNGVVCRYVTSAGPIGGQIPNTFVPAQGGYQQFLASFCSNGGVLNVASLAAALGTATGAGTSFGAADFAVEMVRAPEFQPFTATPSQSALRTEA